MTDAIRASLFATCIVDQFYPEVGESTARVLDRLG
ncbi:MAG TPA: Fe-S oxidoreductase, partial [Dehalococcoidia bacterium]|nr:Fe-S oxidoreductase [Dehalococcoidia bacterium]